MSSCTNVLSVGDAAVEPVLSWKEDSVESDGVRETVDDACDFVFARSRFVDAKTSSHSQYSNPEPIRM